MCGIVGHIGPSGVDLVPALDALSHRGPDDHGIFKAEGNRWAVDLGFVRLSIQDLSELGHQPMGTDDGRLWLVFNGEIYNFHALREELSALGFRFRSRSDSEVVLRGYEAWGDNVTSKLRGMFSFAVWDRRKNRLIAVRDRLGIKPLYWSQVDGRFYFGSEIKGLLALGVPKNLRRSAIPAYLRYNYVPAPATMFREVQSLEPGHQLVWENGRVEISRYWQLPKVGAPVSDKDSLPELRRILDETIAMHMVSDVPVGAFLSGGLDSSTIVALMQRHSSKPVRTFCMTFGPDESHYDERSYAAAVARYIGTEHTEIPVSPDLATLLPTVIRHFDEPFGNPTALLSYSLARETRKHVTVALAGDGGDELFLGYPRYVGAALRSHYQRIPRKVRSLLAQKLAPLIRDSQDGRHIYRRMREFLSEGDSPLAEMYENWVAYYGKSDLRNLLRPNTCLNEDLAVSFISELINLDESDSLVDRVDRADIVSFLPNNLLAYTDRMSMANSLEVRVPFCDHVLAEFVARIPACNKMTILETKRLLRAVAKPLLPREVISRKKLGFNPPMGLWLAGPLRDQVMDNLSKEALAGQDIFEPRAVSNLLNEHLSGARDRSLQIWGLLVYQVWTKMYLQ